MSKIFFPLILLITLFALAISFGFGGNKFHLFPPFIKNFTRDEVRQYLQIVTNPNETKAQIKNDLQNLAQKLGILQLYNNLTAQLQQNAQQLHDIINQNVTGQPLQLFNQLWDIRQDDSITRLAECQQIRAVLNQMTPQVRRQVPLPPPSILGPPPRGCCIFPHPFSRSSSNSEQQQKLENNDQESDNNEDN